MLLIAGQVAVAILGAVAGCAWNSWMHDLLPKEELGGFFAHRLFWATTLALIGGLAGGILIDHWPWGAKIHAYSASFAAAALAGFIGLTFLARVPEPRMAATEASPPLLPMIRAPFRDVNFRRLIVFMTSWSFATNLVAPFLTVYLLQQFQLKLSAVAALWASSQLANAFTLRLWGRLSDRLSNKSILAVAAPLFFGCVLALPFTATPAPHALTFPLLALIHIIMGAATGGAGLATGNIGLMLAPEGQGTAYLAAVSLSGALAAGIAPIVGGALADLFAARKLSIILHWSSPAAVTDVTTLRLEHWEFLFVLAFLCGLHALHALSLLADGPEVSERAVVQELVLEAGRTPCAACPRSAACAPPRSSRSAGWSSGAGGAMGGTAARPRLIRAPCDRAAVGDEPWGSLRLKKIAGDDAKHGEK